MRRADIAAGRLVAHAHGLAEQLDLQRPRHGFGGLSLDREHVLELPVLTMRPDAAAIGGADDVDGDADALAQLTHRTLDQVGDAERGAYACRAVGGVAELEAGILADHLEPVDLGEIRIQLLGKAIGKILLLGIVAVVGQREYRDGSFRQLGQRRVEQRGGGGIVARNELIGDQQHHD